MQYFMIFFIKRKGFIYLLATKYKFIYKYKEQLLIFQVVAL